MGTQHAGLHHPCHGGCLLRCPPVCCCPRGACRYKRREAEKDLPGKPLHQWNVAEGSNETDKGNDDNREIFIHAALKMLHNFHGVKVNCKLAREQHKEEETVKNQK